MAKYEKSIKPSSKGGSKNPQVSFVEGAKMTKTPKPKSLTPKTGKK